MAQHDYTIDNGSGPVVRADINDALDAISTSNLGATAPSPSFPGQIWADTSSDTLWVRNQANTSWIAILNGTWT